MAWSLDLMSTRHRGLLSSGVDRHSRQGLLFSPSIVLFANSSAPLDTMQPRRVVAGKKALAAVV